MNKHLKDIYGFNEFREYQKDIIQDLLNNNDVFAILPTGGGKSLLYQFPATYTNKLTVVVSPLISLMNDQCKHLNSKNIKSVCLNSETCIDIAHYTDYTIIYTTPEFMMSRIEAFYSIKTKIGLFAIDEAHCISQWSHDFRPSYQELGAIKMRFPKIPLLAVTATATPYVLDEMYKFLNVTKLNATEYALGTRRTNLIINVHSKSKFNTTKFYEPTIIYVQTRKLCESLCSDLIKNGIKTTFYHGGMDKIDKEKSHELFINGDIMVIIATISFGMGIDKSDIRHVINYGPPANIETYYQEIGRAGRDGVISKATIYYDDKDFATTAFLIAQSEDEEQIKIKTEAMDIFRSYLQEKHICRQQLIDYYFSTGTFANEHDVAHIEKCGMCDNCTSSRNTELEDITNESDIIVKIITHNKHSCGFDVGLKKIITMLRTNKNYSHHNNSNTRIEEIIDVLVTKKILMRYKAGYGFVIGLGATKLIDVSPIKHRIIANDLKKTITTQISNQDTSITRLMSIRNDLAKKFGMTPASFINDRVLMNIHEKSPKNITELWGIDGISNEFIMTAKCNEFMNEYTRQCGVTDKPIQPPPPQKTKGKTRDHVITLYKQNKSVKEISHVLGIREQTIENHILHIFEHEDDIDVDLDYFDLSEDKEIDIKKAIEKVGIEKLKPIKWKVDESITYAQIKLCILVMKIESL